MLRRVFGEFRLLCFSVASLHKASATRYRHLANDFTTDVIESDCAKLSFTNGASYPAETAPKTVVKPELLVSELPASGLNGESNKAVVACESDAHSRNSSLSTVLSVITSSDECECPGSPDTEVESSEDEAKDAAHQLNKTAVTVDTANSTATSFSTKGGPNNQIVSSGGEADRHVTRPEEDIIAVPSHPELAPAAETSNAAVQESPAMLYCPVLDEFFPASEVPPEALDLNLEEVVITSQPTNKKNQEAPPKPITSLVLHKDSINDSDSDNETDSAA